jgi:dihydrodipicolinate synthase/N-acetylneuraminate lyase
LRGAFAAVLTPLVADGSKVDEGAVAPYVDFLSGSDLTGVMTLGTTGEGILLSLEERKRVSERFADAAVDRLAVAVHCGAQTTRDSVVLAEHAACLGVDAVSAIGPPYFKLDAVGQYRHLRAIADACAPTPFYVYELASAAGYAFELEVLMRLRESCENLAGLKVSDTPWESFARYMLDGLDVLVGPESLIDRGMRAGAVGAISALAAAVPEPVAEAVAHPTPARAERLGELRREVDAMQRHAALKRILAKRGVPICPAVRAPLRDLGEDELERLEAWCARELGDARQAREVGVAQGSGSPRNR